MVIYKKTILVWKVYLSLFNVIELDNSNNKLIIKDINR